MVMERWRPGRGLIPWRPFRELEEMERRFEDIFGRTVFTRSVAASPCGGDGVGTSHRGVRERR